MFTDVAALAPVVAYDRAGNGESADDGQPPTPQHVARRLHALLAEAGARPPYVLVGHSWGGPLITMFQSLYPGEVAGLVYVDPTWPWSEAEERSYSLAKGYKPDDLPGLRQKRRDRLTDPNPEMQVVLAQETSFFANFQPIPPPRVPVAVLLAAKFDPTVWADQPCEPRACQDLFIEFRRTWLTRMTRGNPQSFLTVTDASSHFMPRDAPELVVSSIRRILTSAQTAQ